MVNKYLVGFELFKIVFKNICQNGFFLFLFFNLAKLTIINEKNWPNLAIDHT
jgi:hypothetical protein